ncbi:MAG: polysaccharide deacetylase family protein [Candidatus Tectimicrobiota bacterium]
MSRDLLGYGQHYPWGRWPHGARLAISLVLNYEEGAEQCIGDGDPEGERVGEFIYPSMDAHTRDLGIESTFEYGARVGAWRVLDLFDAYQVKATIYACGRAVERNPEIARAFTARGHEPAAHGYLWCDHFRMTEDEEREVIARAVDAIRQSTGERPVGWYCRYAPSVQTRRLLVEEGGFLYDSDSYADEIPYWVRVGTHPHLVIPYQLDANDAKFFRGPGWSGGTEFFEYLRDSVHFLLHEKPERPRMLSVGLHGRIIGRPGRAAALERFLEYCAHNTDIVFMRRVDIARWWRQHYPPA